MFTREQDASAHTKRCGAATESLKSRRSELRSLAKSLQTDVFNIEVAARHLLQLVEQDGFQQNLPNLSMDQVKVVGARYNRGMGLSLEQIKENTSYGDFIVKIWTRLQGLLK